MSLTIGQSAGYINNIENKNNMPSMTLFFYICEYFNVTPKDFFDFDVENPELLNKVISDLKQLPPEKLNNIATIIQDMKE